MAAAKKTTRRATGAKKAATARKPASLKNGGTVGKASTARKATAAKRGATAKKAGRTAVTVDRRANNDRRMGQDRRNKQGPVAVERRTLERRTKVNRRRQIDPTTCERDYTSDEIEFMSAMDEYKRFSGRMFPTCSEVLEVVKKLGYRKRSGADLPGPADVSAAVPIPELLVPGLPAEGAPEQSAV